MGRQPSTFRKRDAVRLIEAAQAAGMTPQRIWMESGKDGIRLVLGVASDNEHGLEGYEAPEVDTWEDVG